MVEVDAPKAYVSFVAPAAAKKTAVAVGGGSRVTIRAKAVVFGTPVAGPGTVVDVTFSPGGSLKLSAVEDRAVVRYRPEHRADPPVRLIRGWETGGGEVREEPAPGR